VVVVHKELHTTEFCQDVHHPAAAAATAAEEEHTQRGNPLVSCLNTVIVHRLHNRVMWADLCRTQWQKDPLPSKEYKEHWLEVHVAMEVRAVWPHLAQHIISQIKYHQVHHHHLQHHRRQQQG